MFGEIQVGIEAIGLSWILPANQVNNDDKYMKCEGTSVTTYNAPHLYTACYMYELSAIMSISAYFKHDISAWDLYSLSMKSQHLCTTFHSSCSSFTTYHNAFVLFEHSKFLIPVTQSCSLWNSTFALECG